MTNDKIKISWDDVRDPKVDKELARQQVPLPPPGAGTTSTAGLAQPLGPRDYGRVSPLPAPTMQGGIKYSPVFYTALAGLAAAIAAWLLTEYVVQSALEQTAKVSSIVQAALFFAAVGAILGAGLCSVEGIVSRNLSNAVASGAVGFCLGLAGGAVAGGAGQALYALGSAERQWVVMALDTSGSMEGTPLRELKESCTEFIMRQKRSEIQFGIVTFNDAASVASPVTDDLTELSTSIESLVAEGGTNVAAGLRKGRDLLASRQGRRAILLFSDGMPSSYRLDEVFARRRIDREQLSLLLAYFSLPASERRFGPENRLDIPHTSEPMSAAQKDLIEAMIQEALTLACEDAVTEGREAREAGIRIIAIGTGEADRTFLAGVTERPEAVLFAASGEISKAFETAQKLIFKESDGATGAVTAPGVMMRAFGWAFVGALLALGQGIVSRSAKKMRNATIGGFLGGLLGGVLFDPISAGLGAGWASRFVAIAVIGTATGALIGLVENLLKDAWLRVVAGRLTGKQFVIYRNPTMIGSSPKSDIYLFKDATVEPQHAAISNDGHGHFIQDYGTPAGTLVNGRRVSNQRLRSGDTIQVGATQFQYSEKAVQRTGG